MNNRFFAGLILLIAATTPVVAVPVLVSPAQPHGWSLQTLDAAGNPAANGNTAAFVCGPAVPPLGPGSAHFIIPGGQGNTAAELFNANFNGQTLNSITALNYDTFATHINCPVNGQLPFLTLFADTNNSGAENEIIFFCPFNSTATAANPSLLNPQHCIALCTWQNWCVVNGEVFGAATGPGGVCFGCGAGANSISWGAMLALIGNAKIINCPDGLGGLAVGSGFSCPVDAYNTNVGDLTFDNQTFIFGTGNQAPPGAPELDPSSGGAAVGVLAGLSLALGSRRRRA